MDGSRKSRSPVCPTLSSPTVRTSTPVHNGPTPECFSCSHVACRRPSSMYTNCLISTCWSALGLTLTPYPVRPDVSCMHPLNPTSIPRTIGDNGYIHTHVSRCQNRHAERELGRFSRTTGTQNRECYISPHSSKCYRSTPTYGFPLAAQPGQDDR